MPTEMYRKIKHVEYPEAKTYKGKAEMLSLDVKAPFGVLIAKLDWLIKDVIEFYTRQKGSKMLRLAIYDLGETEGLLGLPYRRYNIVWFIHSSPAIGIAIAILGAVAAILIATGFIILAKKVEHVDWGETVKAGLGISRNVMIGIGLLAVIAIVPKLIPER